MYKNEENLTPCCGTIRQPWVKSEKVEISRCPSCGTLYAYHPSRRDKPEFDPWYGETVNQKFLEALKFRRQVQANYILERYKDIFKMGTTLDYGCGQGILVEKALALGFDFHGSDLHISKASSSIPRERLWEAYQPWALPEKVHLRFNRIILLDVLEHHPDPAHFFSALKTIGIEQVIIKVPLVSGPIALISRVLSKMGKPGLLEKLLLVGETAPHVSFFSRKGLIHLAARTGYIIKDSVQFADVGKELPERTRNDKMALPLSCLARLGGGALATISPAWSDTGLFRFDLSLSR